MEHTECKDCELSNGDCGYHFKMDGKTNYDIASLSACDKYGNCMFFKAKAKPQGDLISREALKKYKFAVIKFVQYGGRRNGKTLDAINQAYQQGWNGAIDTVIDDAPAVEPTQGEWINHRNDYGHNIADCSECGKTMQWHDEDEDGIPRYCWYCGAKMGKGGAV